MSDYYTLNGKQVVPAANVHDWSKMFGSRNRIVAKEYVGDMHVSTVFLGLDHRYGGEGPPLVFETMIFNGIEEYQERCSTWAEAEIIHTDAMKVARRWYRWWWLIILWRSLK